MQTEVRGKTGVLAKDDLKLRVFCGNMQLHARKEKCTQGARKWITDNETCPKSIGIMQFCEGKKRAWSMPDGSICGPHSKSSTWSSPKSWKSVYHGLQKLLPCMEGW